MADCLDAALALAALDYPVLPCVPNEKRPLTDHGLLDASTDAELINEWWTKWPDANLAIATAGLLVVDVDVKDDQPNPWLADQSEKTRDLATSPTATTPRGGRHSFFRPPAGKVLRNTSGKLASNVDTRADGGYVLVAPSVVNGAPYRWTEGLALAVPRDQLPEAPAWLLAMLESPATPSSVRAESHVVTGKIPAGQRNSTLTTLAGAMRRRGATQSEILSALRTANAERCERPLQESEVETIAKSVARYEPTAVECQVKSPSRPIITCLADVAPEAVLWLWPGRIALGKLTMLVGDPGLGKSFVSLDLAARVSRGSAWPDDPATTAPLGSVVLLNAEDALGDTIRPRLDTLGATVSKIVAIEAIQDEHRRAVNLQKDLSAIETAIEQVGDCKLVVIDPVSAYLGKVDSHNNADVRALLHPLSDLADRHKVAVLAVSHLNKSQNGSALYRATGSLAFVAAARAAWLVAKDSESDNRRVFLPLKNNLALDTQGMAFAITSPGRVRWDSQPVTLKADEVLAGAGDATPDWLRKTLADGPLPTKELFSAGAANGYSQKQLRTARNKIGAISRKSGFAGGWEWCLDTKAPEEAQVSPVPEKGALGAFETALAT